MQTIAISKFKATCLGLLEEIKQTGKEMLVTKKGSPLALVGPPPALKKNRNSFGIMKENTQIQGDIISPLLLDLWKVLKS